MGILILSTSICCAGFLILGTFGAVHYEDNGVGFCAGLLALAAGASFVFTLWVFEESEAVPPIAVYQGKTDIQVTYTVQGNDTIKCDSTVVWRK